MSRKQRTAVTLLLIAIFMTTFPGSPSARAGVAQATLPQCALLDNPSIRARMSGIFEEALMKACGRTTAQAATAYGIPVPAVSVQDGPDVRVNGIDPLVSSTTQSETSIAINPVTGTICSNYNDSYHYHIQGTGYIGFSRSIDGGQTFEDGGVLPSGGGGVSRGDPSVVWRASDGYFYATSIHESSSWGLGFWRSIDDCQTFQWVGLSHAGSSDDKEMMAVDNNPSSPYYGHFYIAWTDFGSGGYIRLVRSDNGTTWSSPVTVSSSTSVQGAWPAVAPNGDIYVAWLRWTNGDFMSFEVVRSTNGGVSFAPVTNPRSNVFIPYDVDASNLCGREALNGRIRYLPSPQIAVGPDSCLHVVYSYDPDGVNIGDVVNSYYRRSCDNGLTWDPEVLLNDDSTLTDQFFPSVAVNSNNVVAASWYDRRLDPAGNMLFDRYKAMSFNGGTTWVPNERVSDVSSPVYINPQSSACYHGDYDQLAVDNNWLYVQWSDDRVFFNGHQDPDIWFERQPVGFTPEPDFTLTVEPASQTVCLPAVVTSTVTLDPLNGYSLPVSLNDSGLPTGVTTAFSSNPVIVPGTSVYTITAGSEAVVGDWNWTISATDGTISHSTMLSLTVAGTAPGVPLFTWDPQEPLPGMEITFTAEVTGTSPLAFTWDWGDGTTGSGSPAAHTYTSPGSYSVVLMVTNACGSRIVTQSIKIPYRFYLPFMRKSGP